MATPWVRWFWSDYNADTAHLDLMQLGAYQRLLGFVYQRGQPLPGSLEHIYRIAHATSAMEQTAIQQVLEQYFVPFEDLERGPCWRHLRCEREIERAEGLHAMHSERARNAAAARWERDRYAPSNAPSNAPSTPQAMLKQCQPEPEPDKDKTPPIGVPPKGGKTSIRFVAPGLDLVAAYCAERGNHVDPQQFVDYYTANGWRVGKNPMKDWKAAVRTWERNHHAPQAHRTETRNDRDARITRELLKLSGRDADGRPSERPVFGVPGDLGPTLDGPDR